jgi:hypothetical protein
MVENWRMTIWSDQPTDLWHGEARRLRATLNAISACVLSQYGEPLTWRSETLDADGWRDIDQLAAHLDSHQLRDDAGKIMRGGGATATRPRSTARSTSTPASPNGEPTPSTSTRPPG